MDLCGGVVAAFVVIGACFGMAALVEWGVDAIIGGPENT